MRDQKGSDSGREVGLGLRKGQTVSLGEDAAWYVNAGGCMEHEKISQTASFG